MANAARGEAHRDLLFQSGIRRRTTLTIRDDVDESILGRLHSEDEMDLDLDMAGFDRLISLASSRTPSPWTIDGDAFISPRGGSTHSLLHCGDLHVRGSLLLDEGAWLMCTGDVFVDGIVSDNRRSTLAVGGNLLAGRIVSSSTIFVRKSLLASDLVFARGHGPRFDVAGSIRAPRIFTHERQVMASEFMGEAFDLETVDVETIRARFFDEVLTPSGFVDPSRCERRLRCGLDILR